MVEGKGWCDPKTQVCLLIGGDDLASIDVPPRSMPLGFTEKDSAHEQEDQRALQARRQCFSGAAELVRPIQCGIL